MWAALANGAHQLALTASFLSSLSRARTYGQLCPRAQDSFVSVAGQIRWGIATTVSNLAALHATKSNNVGLIDSARAEVALEAEPIASSEPAQLLLRARDAVSDCLQRWPQLVDAQDSLLAIALVEELDLLAHADWIGDRVAAVCSGVTPHPDPAQ